MVTTLFRLCIATATLLLFGCGGKDRSELLANQSATSLYLGQRTAQEVSSQLEADSVVLVLPGINSATAPYAEAWEKGFTEAAAELQLTIVETIHIPGDQQPPPALFDLVSAHSTGAVVSFAGFPEVTNQASDWKKSKLKLAVVGDPLASLKKLLRSGIVDLAIVTRLAPPSAPVADPTPEQAFDNQRAVYTKANADDMQAIRGAP